ncbi:copper resistance protein B [Sphingomonas sp. GCM10030256]|uniref:copper resistance protein B n=1 Tax=Sphingomonas sp. GCM10030256 TaxID=3273427 RepID=UPI0036121B79
MKRLLMILAATALSTAPALAQHAGHNPHAGHVMPAKKPAPRKAPAKKPVAKKPVAKKPLAKKPASTKPAVKKAVAKPSAGKRATARKPVPKAQPARKPATKAIDPHAGHRAAMPASTLQKDPHAGHAVPQTDPHAGHTMPPPDPHAGHAMPQATPPPAMADPHAGHTMPPSPVAGADPHAGHGTGDTAAAPPVAGPPPEALSGPEHAADAFWGAGEMQRARRGLLAEHGDMPAYKVLVDQAETRLRKDRDGYFVNAEAWYGGDIDKLWLKTEVEGDHGSKPEQAEVQGLWSHAIDPWFDLQTGIRVDLRPQRRPHLVVGVQGLAPYWIEVDAAAFLSSKGDVTARFEAEHDARITQKLILQPRAELDFALQDIRDERIGAGLSNAELGLRLRYQVTQQFSPYVGIAYERAFGDTRRFRRADGDDIGGAALVAGLRLWF